MTEAEPVSELSIDLNQRQEMSVYQFSRAIGMDIARFYRDYLRTGQCTITVIPGKQFSRRPKIFITPMEITQIREKIHPSAKSK